MPLRKVPTPTPTVVVRKKRPVTAPIPASSSVTPRPVGAKPLTPPAAPSPVNRKLVAAKPVVPQKDPVQPPPQSTAPPVMTKPAQPPMAPSATDAPPQSGQPNYRQRLHQARLEVLAILRERWPQTFPADFRQVKPFALGLHLDIQKALPDVKPNVLRNAIHYYQRGGKGAYWRALLKGGPRYNLDGTPTGEVTEQDKEFAKQELAKEKAWWQAKRAGQPRPTAPQADVSSPKITG